MAIILLPLMAIAVLAGIWLVDSARTTATNVFDRSLLSAALAVSTDVAISEGDALSERTRDILSDTSGGPVFYHVYGPDGVIVAGYATPPVGIPANNSDVAEPTFFTATYFGRAVSGVRLQSRTQIDGFAGIFTTTVWQDTDLRASFVQDLVLRALTTIAGLMAALAFIVWFGVRIGLRPLLDLQQAIEARSGEELSPIRRPVPIEVQGIVQTLNSLFGQVSRSMTAQSEFISNAAHQLRNPIAGVLSLAEAVHGAPNWNAAQKRSADLLDAAQETADLSQKLLLLERAKSISPASTHEMVDLGARLSGWIETWRTTLPDTVALHADTNDDLAAIRCDPTMLREALSNLIDNALRHGGTALTSITIAARRDSSAVYLDVTDDGTGLPPDSMEKARTRFEQLADTSGSGLGLSIVEAIAESHGGTMTLSPKKPGLRVTVKFPT